MRPTYSAEAEAYREKVQAFLAEKLPAKWGGIGALEGDDSQRVRHASGARRCSRPATWRRVGRPSTAAPDCRHSSR